MAATVASELGEQIAKTLNSRGALATFRTETYQLLATSPVAVLAVEPVSSRGPLTCTRAKGGLVAPLAPTPPPTTRVPAGHVAKLPADCEAGIANDFATTVASEPGAAAPAAAIAGKAPRSVAARSGLANRRGPPLACPRTPVAISAAIRLILSVFRNIRSSVFG